jgi:hypothetical protein
MRLMLIFHFDINVGANGSSIVTLETASYLLKIYYHSIGVAIFCRLVYFKKVHNTRIILFFKYSLLQHEKKWFSVH